MKTEKQHNDKLTGQSIVIRLFDDLEAQRFLECTHFRKACQSCREQIEAKTIKSLGYPPGTTKDMIIKAEQKMLVAFEAETQRKCWEDIAAAENLYPVSKSEIKKKWGIG